MSLPRVREPHWRPGEWPRPVCPGPEGNEPACGAPVKYYKPLGKEKEEGEWEPSDPVKMVPCAHIIPASAVGVVSFRRPPDDQPEHERVRDGAQLYLSQFR